MTARAIFCILVGSVAPFCGSCTHLHLASSHAEQQLSDQQHGPPSEPEQHRESLKCTNECRWKYGLDKKAITGLTVERSSPETCRCYDGSKLLMRIPKWSKKAFDVNTTWSGERRSGFSSSSVCIKRGKSIVTMARHEGEELAKEKGGDAKLLHCGECGACSAVADIEILAKSRNWITEALTKTMTKFASPLGGHYSVPRLMSDLEKIGLNFSQERYDGRTDLMSCMDVWIGDMLCAASTCKTSCWVKFLGKTTGKFHHKCLQCDEDYCGPQFIKGAGANRRSVGLLSDIERPEKHICKDGFYSKTPESKLPTAPNPVGV